MRRVSVLLLMGIPFLSVAGWGQTNSCDLTNDGKVDTSDVQAAINMSLGLLPCTANVAGPNVCNVVVVQRIVNATLPGGTCVTSAGIHNVSITWTASSSTGVTGYHVYRGTTSNGPYTLVSSLGNLTTYTDNTVQSGVTYYYVVRAVDSTNTESSNSNQSQIVIPVP